MQKKQTTLRFRLILLTLTVLFLTIAIITTLTINLLSNIMLDQMTEDGITIATAARIAMENRLLSDNSIAGLQEVLDTLGEHEQIGYICLLDGNAVDVADSDHDDIGTDYSDDGTSIDIIRSRETVTAFWTDEDGTTYLDVYTPAELVYDGGTALCVDIGIRLDKYVEARRLSIMQSIAFAALLMAMATGIMALAMRRMVNSPVRNIKETLARLAKGNLKPDSMFDAIQKTTWYTAGANSREFVEIRAEMEKVRRSIGSIAENVLNEEKSAVVASSSLKSSVQTANERMADISSRTESLSAASQETAAASEEVDAAVHEIGSELAKLAGMASSGREMANEISGRAETLSESAVRAQQEAISLQRTALERLKAAMDRASNVSQVEMLSQTILQITSQTGLLALNAAIESARAGTLGNGFAVVADEIRKLAEQSKKTATEINQVTREVVDAVQDLSQASGEIARFVETRVMKDYDSLALTGEQYHRDAEQVKQLISDVSLVTGRLDRQSVNIQSAMENIRKVVDDNASNAGLIANAASETMEAVGDVQECGEKVFLSIESINRSTSRFDI